MTSYQEDVLRFMLLNLEVDGGPEDPPGTLPLRWRRAYEEILAPRRPDWLARPEMTYSQTRQDDSPEEKAAANRRFDAAQTTLGMTGFRGPMGQGRNPTGLFVRESTFTVGRRYEQTKVWRTPPVNVVLTLPEVPEVPIVTAAWHNSFCSPSGREEEAEELSALVDKVKAQHGTEPGRPRAAFIGFGDCNEYPHPVGEKLSEIDWNSPEVTDVVHRRHRARKQPDGSWRSCTYLDELMLDCGMHDPARYAARHLNQPAALNSTAGHAAVGQGTGSRIDRGYMDAWTVQAVLDVTVVDTTGISDHHALEVILSRRKFAEGLRRGFSALQPWALAV
jgi:hypothetical protein